MLYEQDTISAIATASGESGIAIVRVSGPKALSIADQLVACSGPRPSERPAQSFVYGSIRDPEKCEALDEVIVLIYRAPNSYTREDVIEIQGHGGATSARRLLRATLDAGARPADAGEFTQRAFLNGRIDLMQAEAVIDLIRAGSDRAANAAVEQLSGRLSHSFNGLYDDLIAIAGDLEATLDFGEAELPAATMQDIIRRLSGLDSNMAKLLSTWEEGHLLREGALVVIAGQPNVGKSTLLNTLLGIDRAIVTEVAGTTRDTIEEGLSLEGIPLRLVDTAGLRETSDKIEAEGIERARKLMTSADLHLYLLDASQPIQPVDQENIETLDPSKSLILLNKADLGVQIDASAFPGYTALSTSLKTDPDLSAIRTAMLKLLGDNLDAPAHAVISERHRDLLSTARDHIQTALDILQHENEDGAAAAALDCRSALEAIGTATGRVYHDELLTNIFSRFCVGK